MTHLEIIQKLRAENPYHYMELWACWNSCCDKLFWLLRENQPTDADIYEALGKTSDYDAKYLKLGKDAQILRPSEVVEAVRLLLTKQKTETDENKENLLN